MGSARSTKDDKQVAAALAIRGVASILKSHQSAIDNVLQVINDPSAFTKMEIAATKRTLKETSLDSLSGQLLESVKILDPISSLDYVFSRQKSTALQENVKKCPPAAPISAPAKQDPEPLKKIPEDCPISTPACIKTAG